MATLKLASTPPLPSSVAFQRVTAPVAVTKKLTRLPASCCVEYCRWMSTWPDRRSYLMLHDDKKPIGSSLNPSPFDCLPRCGNATGSPYAVGDRTPATLSWVERGFAEPGGGRRRRYE